MGQTSKQAILIHGTKGSPEINWFQSVSDELRACGVSAIVPQFPTPEGQSLESWLRCLRSSAGALGGNTILIGHSIGAVLALRALECSATAVDAAVLVAGFTGTLGLPEYDALNASFVAAPFDWRKIRSSARCIICISGDNDPYVPFAQGKQIAESLGVAHIVIPGGGHLNAEFGYTSFPRICQELKGAGVLAG